MLELGVKGMTCGHCIAAIREAVAEVAPAAEVDLARGRVAVRGAERAESVEAIRAAGYEVGPAEMRKTACGCGGH
ncbi:heavy-metal-associated domain-containing protein [Benzoatithermus flavus]|uniref:Cation transporter n=1 Tax=Benzoatithermus flavus TaxID=3108223 RepID=A0ABU8XMD0_9PROT